MNEHIRNIDFIVQCFGRESHRTVTLYIAKMIWNISIIQCAYRGFVKPFSFLAPTLRIIRKYKKKQFEHTPYRIYFKWFWLIGVIIISWYGCNYDDEKSERRNMLVIQRTYKYMAIKFCLHWTEQRQHKLEYRAKCS